MTLSEKSEKEKWYKNAAHNLMVLGHLVSDEDLVGLLVHVFDLRAVGVVVED